MTSLDAFGKQDVSKIGLKTAAQGLSTLVLGRGKNLPFFVDE